MDDFAWDTYQRAEELDEFADEFPDHIRFAAIQMHAWPMLQHPQSEITTPQGWNWIAGNRRNIMETIERKFVQSARQASNRVQPGRTKSNPVAPEFSRLRHFSSSRGKLLGNERKRQGSNLNKEIDTPKCFGIECGMARPLRIEISGE